MTGNIKKLPTSNIDYVRISRNTFYNRGTRNIFYNRGI